MKKKLIIILSSILGFIVLFSVGSIIHTNIVNKRNEEVQKNTSYYKACQLVNDNNVNIMVYGEEKRSFQYLTINNINSLTDMKLENDYNVLIVNDLFTETTMDDSDYLNIVNIVARGDNKLMFLYFGNKKFDKLMEFGIETTKPKEDTFGVMYGPSIYHSGLCYTKSDYEMSLRSTNFFEESLAYLIVDDYLKEVI